MKIEIDNNIFWHFPGKLSFEIENDLGDKIKLDINKAILKNNLDI